MSNWIIKGWTGSYWSVESGWVEDQTKATVYSDRDHDLTGGCSWVELKPKEKPVCSTCGSDDIKTDAYAVWDIGRQEWVLDQAFEKPATCEKCGGECSLEWVKA